jgi:hypothetical protein
MGSGDSPGLQNRRSLSLMAMVGSTPTRFRQVEFPLYARDFGSGLSSSLRSESRPLTASTSKPAGGGFARRRCVRLAHASAKFLGSSRFDSGRLRRRAKGSTLSRHALSNR